MKKRIKIAIFVISWFAFSNPLFAAAQTSTTAPIKGAHTNAHPDLSSARRMLYQARARLQTAPDDSGGHRAQALQLVNQAITQVNQALQLADQTPAPSASSTSP